MDVRTTLLKDHLGITGYLLVKAAQHSGKAFNDGNLAAKVSKERSKFCTDDTAADYDET